MIYRVVLRVSFYERWFDFDDMMDAANFANTIINHEVESEDHKEKTTEVTITVVKKEVVEE